MIVVLLTLCRYVSDVMFHVSVVIRCLGERVLDVRGVMFHVSVVVRCLGKRTFEIHFVFN